MKKARKQYKRLRFEDRQQIEQLLKDGKTVDEVALIVGVHSSTMYRELERGGDPYRAEIAQRNI